MTAVKPRSKLLVVLCLAPLLSCCSSVGSFVGATAGVVTGAVSSNPAIGVAVGISVQAATDSVLQRFSRDMQADEQGRIADVAGSLDVGQRSAWEVHRRFYFGDAHGEVEVLSVIENPLASCKEVMFSVDAIKDRVPTRDWFVTQTCRQADGHWQWAAAEPAVVGERFSNGIRKRAKAPVCRAGPPNALVGGLLRRSDARPADNVL